MELNPLCQQELRVIRFKDDRGQKVPRDQKLKPYLNCISNTDRIPRGGEENNSWLSIQHLLVQNVGYPALGGGSGSSKNRELIKGKKITGDIGSRGGGGLTA